MQKLSIKTVGFPTGILFAVSYTLCVIFDLVFPGWAMYQLWQSLLPGFSWSITGLLIGLIETILYGFYIIVIWVPVYNYLHQQEIQTDVSQMRHITTVPNH